MKLEPVFDMLTARYRANQQGIDVPNWTAGKKKDGSDIVLSPMQQVIYASRAIQAFMHETGIPDADGKRIIQAFTGSSNLPTLTKDVFTVTNQVPNWDLGWQRAFKGVQLKRGQLSWEIADVENGASFTLVPEGAKIELGRYDGNKATATIQKYGMAIGLTWETVEGNKLYLFVDLIEQTRAKLYKLWADIHYGLLAAGAAAHAVAYDTTGATPLAKDVITINTAYTTVGNATKDKGYGDTANMPMLLFASPLLKARIMAAMRTVLNDNPAGGNVVQFAVEPVFTWNSAIPAGKALMVLPGNKIQNSVYLEQLALERQSFDNLTSEQFYWTAFGAIVADSTQCAEVAFS